MKHLVSYNESATYIRMRNILYDLKDICIELEDKGYTIKVSPDNEIHIKVLSLQDRVLKNISIPFYVEVTRFIGYKKEFNPSYFSDIISHIVEYMKTNGYNTKFLINKPHNSQILNQFVEISQDKLDKYIYTLRLEFKKIDSGENLLEKSFINTK